MIFKTTTKVNFAMKLVLLFCFLVAVNAQKKPAKPAATAAAPAATTPKPVAPPKPLGFDYVGVLKMDPAIPFICDVIYIYPGFFIASASCVAGYNAKKLSVEMWVSNGPKVFKVNQNLLHPNYTSGNNEFDIALIKTENFTIPNLKPKIAKGYPKIWMPGYLYSRQINEASKKFELESLPGKAMMYSKCDDKVVPVTRLCVSMDAELTTGPYDYGAPFMTQTHNELMGMRTDNKTEEGVKSFNFLNLVEFETWITDTIQKNRVECPPVYLTDDSYVNL